LNFKIILLLIPVMILIFLMPLFQTEQTTYIDFSKASIQFNGTDAVFTLYYDLTPAARAYILAFGTSNLEPRIREVFTNFEDIEIISIKPEVSRIKVRNISTSTENYYLHHAVELSTTIGVLKVYTPNSRQPREYYNINATPNIFYPK
jgi:hypothetical protein